MVSLWNMVRLFFIYFILSIQNSFYEASPLVGPSKKVDLPRKFPFIVSINNKTRLDMYRTGNYLASENAHFCGGSLITKYHVLTAAHCLTPWERFDEVVIKTGFLDLRTANDSNVREVSWWYTYCQYYNVTLPIKYYDDRKEIIYDIAIMKLETPVEDVQLPTISYIPDELLYGKLGVIGGWGRIEDDVQPRYMRFARFFILDRIKCNRIIKDRRLEEANPPLFLCSTIPCARASKGDSGGPLLSDGTNTAYPYNIVGVNRAVCPAGERAACQFINSHVSINAYRSFIEKLTQNENGTVTHV